MSHGTEDIARMVTQRVISRGRRQGRKFETHRLTVHYKSGPITGSWYAQNLVEWAAQYYEYHIGVSATVEKRP